MSVTQIGTGGTTEVKIIGEAIPAPQIVVDMTPVKDLAASVSDIESALRDVTSMVRYLAESPKPAPQITLSPEISVKTPEIKLPSVIVHRTPPEDGAIWPSWSKAYARAAITLLAIMAAAIIRIAITH